MKAIRISLRRFKLPKTKCSLWYMPERRDRDERTKAFRNT